MPLQWTENVLFNANTTNGGDWVGDTSAPQDDDTDFCGAADTGRYWSGVNATPFPARNGDVQLIRLRCRVRRQGTGTGSMDVTGFFRSPTALEKAIVSLPANGGFIEYTIEGDAAFWGATQQELNDCVDEVAGNNNAGIWRRGTAGTLDTLDIQFVCIQAYYDFEVQTLVFPPVL